MNFTTVVRNFTTSIRVFEKSLEQACARSSYMSLHFRVHVLRGEGINKRVSKDSSLQRIESERKQLVTDPASAWPIAKFVLETSKICPCIATARSVPGSRCISVAKSCKRFTESMGGSTRHRVSICEYTRFTRRKFRRGYRHSFFFFFFFYR